MDSEQKLRQQVRLSIVAATAGDMTDEQCAELSELLASSKTLAQYAQALLSHEAHLYQLGARYASQGAISELLTVSHPCATRTAASPGLEGAVPIPIEARSIGLGSRSARGAQVGTAGSGVLRPRNALARWSRVLSAACLFGLGLAAGILGTHLAVENAVVASYDRSSQEAVLPDATQPTVPVMAQLTRTRQCVWEPAADSPGFSNGRIQGGERLSLVDGIAEFELASPIAGTASVRMEGPAKMRLSTDGMPEIEWGRFFVEGHPQAGAVLLDCRFGEVRLAPETTAGVELSKNKLEVHVFSGVAVLTGPWHHDSESRELLVPAKESLTMKLQQDSLAISRGTAIAGRFAEAPIGPSDRLPIGGGYVREVLKSGPIVYWRFENIDRGRVRNEVSGELNGIVQGDVSLGGQAPNRVAVLNVCRGAGLVGSITSAESLGTALRDQYAVELWINPDHYHHGSITSFYSDSETIGLHGLLLEVGGLPPAPMYTQQCARLRFLHRNPIGENGGTACFSSDPYEVRRWSHLVAVKDGIDQRVYVNGVLAAAEIEYSELREDLRVLVGILDHQRKLRPFRGELDEIAIYPRALTGEEIRRHFELGKSSEIPHDTI